MKTCVTVHTAAGNKAHFVTYNPGHNILAPFNNLADVLIPQVKRYLISNITTLVHELPQELPNDLRLRILGN